MADAKSLSAKHVVAATKKTVAHVRARHKALEREPTILGFVRPPWWWIGLILREREIENIAEAEQLAASLHEGIAAAVPELKSAKPGVLIQGGITVGFIAPPELQKLEIE